MSQKQRSSISFWLVLALAVVALVLLSYSHTFRQLLNSTTLWAKDVIGSRPILGALGLFRLLSTLRDAGLCLNGSSGAGRQSGLGKSIDAFVCSGIVAASVVIALTARFLFRKFRKHRRKAITRRVGTDNELGHQVNDFDSFSH